MPHRVRVVGNSGVGKTRLARDLARRLQVPYLEVDALHHRAGWQEAPVGELRAAVQHALDDYEASHGGWVADGNYASVEDLLAAADTIVWLDYARHVVVWRVVRRTLARLVARVQLWNGNRERWRSLVNRDPRENIIVWSWTHHHVYRTRYEQASAAADTAAWVRLRHPEQARQWLAQQRPVVGPPSATG